MYFIMEILISTFSSFIYKRFSQNYKYIFLHTVLTTLCYRVDLYILADFFYTESFTKTVLVTDNKKLAETA